MAKLPTDPRLKAARRLVDAVVAKAGAADYTTGPTQPEGAVMITTPQAPLRGTVTLIPDSRNGVLIRSKYLNEMALVLPDLALVGKQFVAKGKTFDETATLILQCIVKAWKLGP